MIFFTRVLICGIAISLIAIGASAQYCQCDPVTGVCTLFESPLAINLNSGAWRLTGLNDPVQFDIRAVGRKDFIGWTERDSDIALLALDRNGDGIINDGSELFGNATQLPNGQRAPNGFVALAQYDENHDAVIDSSDPVWNSLLLWLDRNHDGISQPDELTRVSASTITTIGLVYHWTGRHDALGNVFMSQGLVRIRNRTQSFYDIFFVDAAAQFRQADATPTTLHKPIADDEVARELTAQPIEVWQTYSSISKMSAPDRRSAFRSLSSSMQAAVWKHHALKVIVGHPEFTPDQKLVITDFLSLLTPEFFEITSSSPLWSDRVDAPLQEIHARAISVFGAKLAHAIIADLGAETESAARSTELTPSADSKRRLPPISNIPNCECSTASDWCASPPLGSPGYQCSQGGCYFSPKGCGDAFDYSCTGLCYYTGTG